MRHTFWKNGDYNAVCDVCGFKYKASQLKTRWDGLKVCASDYEERHPLELARLFPNNPSPDWTAPESSDVFIPRTIPLNVSSSLSLSSSISLELLLFDGSIGINTNELNFGALNT